MPNHATEEHIAQRFANWLSHATGRQHTVMAGADPPDFIMKPEGWLELTDIYLSDAQGKFLNTTQPRFSYECSPDETALRLINKLNEKLSKLSYREVYTRRGRGTLLLTCQDCVFDQVNLARVHECLTPFRPTDDRGFFGAAYFEYQLPGQPRVYEIVYSRRA
jgi:hypothetical protein